MESYNGHQSPSALSHYGLVSGTELVVSTIKTTIGPKGMAKMIIKNGDVIITSEGSKVLQAINVSHPTAKLLCEVSQIHADHLGDGTTSAVIFAGTLLSKSEPLLAKEIHPITIVEGYREAANITRRAFENLTIDENDTPNNRLEDIISTSLNGIMPGPMKSHLSELISKSLLKQHTEGDVNLDNIKMERHPGGGINESEIIEGILLGKKRMSPKMPSHSNKATIALLDSKLHEIESKIDIHERVERAQERGRFRRRKNRDIDRKIEQLDDLDIDFLFCQRDISNRAREGLIDLNIAGVRRVNRSDINLISRTTGADIVSEVNDISAEDLGEAGFISQQLMGDDERILIRSPMAKSASTILLRGGTDKVVQKISRDVENALKVGKLGLGNVLPGGGAPEINAALKLRNKSTSIDDRQQIAIQAFADALEEIPRMIVKNAGVDPIDIIVQLQSHHSANDYFKGFEADKAEIKNMRRAGVIEPLALKTQMIDTALQVTTMILRTDDIINVDNLNLYQ